MALGFLAKSSAWNLADWMCCRSMCEVSVIGAFYNVEPYIREFVESALNQTFRDVELILVDDGSPSTLRGQSPGRFSRTTSDALVPRCKAHPRDARPRQIICMRAVAVRTSTSSATVLFA